MKWLWLTLFFLISCQTSGKAEKQDKPPIPWVEIRPVPQPSPGTITPLPADAASPEELAAMQLLQIPPDGYVFSADKYEGMLNLRLSLEQLHADATMNTKLGEIWTDTMWKQLADADAALDEAVRRENTWWNRNKGSVYFGGGFFLGALSTILIVYGVDQALEQ